jgi:hypothetical protein
MKTKPWNTSRKSHARLLHALYNLMHPEVEADGLRWNLKHRLHKWAKTPRKI